MMPRTVATTPRQPAELPQPVLEYVAILECELLEHQERWFRLKLRFR